MGRGVGLSVTTIAPLQNLLDYRERIGPERLGYHDIILPEYREAEQKSGSQLHTEARSM
jgi:hypothetical protein